MPIEQLVATAREIARGIRVPLTVDIEGGYSDDPGFVARVVDGVTEAGAVGINIEDRAGNPEVLCSKIEAARQTASRTGVDLFINARTDVYLREIATGTAAIEEVVRRAKRYQEAGCDGLFVPALVEGLAVEAIAAAIHPLPLNIMLVPGLPSNTVLRTQGVRRLSAGSAIAQAALGLTSRLTTAFLAGSSDEMFADAAEYGPLNELFASN